MAYDADVLCPVCRCRDKVVSLIFTCQHQSCAVCLVDMYDPDPRTGHSFINCVQCASETERSLNAPVQESDVPLHTDSTDILNTNLTLLRFGRRPIYSEPIPLFSIQRPRGGPREGEDFWWLHLTVDRKDHLLVSDRENNVIQVIDQNGTYIRAIGGEGTEVNLKEPRDLAVNDFEEILVADSGNKRMAVLTLDGEFKYAVHEPFIDQSISGLTAWRDIVCVTDYKRLCVLKRDEATGRYRFQSEVARNKFGTLTGITMNSNGIWVTDWINRYLYHFTTEEKPTYMGRLDLKEYWLRCSIADHNGVLHVGDKNRKRIALLVNQGEELDGYDINGYPGSFAFLSDGSLVYTVMDGEVGRVMKMTRIREEEFDVSRIL